MAKRKIPPTSVNDAGSVVFHKETPEDVLIAELELQQARDEAKARKKKAPKVIEQPPTEKQLQVFTSDGDLLDIWQRRMINPTLRDEQKIRLKVPGMHLRWINLSNNGRYQRARYGEGWMPVRKVELVDEREIFGSSFTTEGYVCRGEKQSEMLMRIPEAVWKQIQSRKFAAIEKSNRNIKEQMMGSGAAHLNEKYGKGGDEAAERAMGARGTPGAFRGDISFGREQVEPDADILENDLTIAE